MALLDEFNANWEPSLTGLTAQVWCAMKSLGVTAHWIDPLAENPVLLHQHMGLTGWNVQASEFYTFVVQYKNETLVKARRYNADETLVVLTALSDAANQLEMCGHQVIPNLGF